MQHYDLALLFKNKVLQKWGEIAETADMSKSPTDEQYREIGEFVVNLIVRQYLDRIDEDGAQVSDRE